MNFILRSVPFQLGFAILFGLTPLARAQEPPPSIVVLDQGPRPWTARFLPYGWLPGLDGDLTVRGLSAAVDVDISKTWNLIMHDLDFTFMGQVEAQSGNVGFIVNNVYAKFTIDDSIGRLDFNSALSLTALDVAATYELPGVPDLLHLPCGSQFQVLAGVRYNALRAGLTVTGPLGNTVSDRGTQDWWDPVIGFRTRVPVHSCLTAQLRADIGGFDIGDGSRFTWNVEATLEYQWSERVSLLAGWRVLDIDRTTGSGNQRFTYDMNLSGPLMGIAINF